MRSLPLWRPAWPVSGLLTEIVDGFSQPQKRLPSKLFYDERGSRLFDLICETPEYYVTRTELAILRGNLGEIAAFLGPRCAVVEPGAGNGLKTRSLLAALPAPAAYVPVDVAEQHLHDCATRAVAQHPALTVLPICEDFTRLASLPMLPPGARTAIFFPGSTIGNFEPPQAGQLLRNFRRLAGAGGALLLGVDTRKAPAILERAYNDAAGVTARFNLNMLLRLNREFGGTFDVDLFSHLSFYDSLHGRIEMHLRSERAQTVRLGGRLWALRQGETIHTENSYKYRPAEFAVMAEQAGWRLRHCWCDADGWFSVQGFEAA